jgi:hypothetical protein
MRRRRLLSQSYYLMSFPIQQIGNSLGIQHGCCIHTAYQFLSVPGHTCQRHIGHPVFTSQQGDVRATATDDLFEGCGVVHTVVWSKWQGYPVKWGDPSCDARSASNAKVWCSAWSPGQLFGISLIRSWRCYHHPTLVSTIKLSTEQIKLWASM